MFARTLLLSAALLALISCQTTTATSTPAQVTHFRGVAYTFNTPKPIAGATISVAELPQFVTTTDANGYYDLAVEVTSDSQKVTPFIAKTGFHTIYLQTWTLHPGDADLEHVHFQTPDDDTFFVLATLVGVGPKTTQCQVVTTSSDKVVQGMTYEQFRDHGAHGVGGVKATATAVIGGAVVPGPIYFNSKVVPDPKLTESSDDGGILWTNVPDGEFVLHGSHATRKFSDVTITCAPNRIVNANPPWGMHEIP